MCFIKIIIGNKIKKKHVFHSVKLHKYMIINK
jgi:hypothetical protein